MNIRAAHTLDDIRELARRKLPRIAFDFIDGGSDDELCLQRNREAFQRWRLMPRYLVDVSKRIESLKREREEHHDGNAGREHLW